MKNWQHDPIHFAPIAKLGGGWVAFKDAPSAPATPDYAGAAQAQGAANVETARTQGRMNNPNVYTPYGSQTVTWGQAGTPGTPGTPGTTSYNWNGNTYQDEAGVRGALGQWASQSGLDPSYVDQWMNQPGVVNRTTTGATEGTPGTPGDPDQPTITQTLAPAQQSLLDSQNRISQNIAGVAESAVNRVGDAVAQPYDTSGLNPISTSAGANPNYTRNVNASPLQTSYNQGGDVRYQNGYNSPIQGQIDTSGVQGIPQVDAQARQHAEDLAYQAATSRLDPQWAQRNAMQDTQLRNQGLVPGGEAYTNAKRDLGYQQNDAYLQAQANAVNQGLTNQQAQFNMGLAANQTGFGQAQNQGQFANSAQAQGYGQAQTDQQAYNAAQAQANTQNQQQAAFGNTAAQNQFSMGQQNAALGNQVGQQEFSQGLANANLGNQATQQQIQQQAYLRSLPLNELNAMRTGAQVQNPTFSGYSPTTIGQTPIFGAAQAQGTANQNAYNQQAGAANSFNSGLMSMLGTAGGIYAGSPAGGAAIGRLFG